MDMKFEDQKVVFEVPKGYEQAERDSDMLTYVCPKCEDSALQPHPSKPFAKCKECEIEYRMKKRTAAFVQPIE